MITLKFDIVIINFDSVKLNLVSVLNRVQPIYIKNTTMLDKIIAILREVSQLDTCGRKITTDIKSKHHGRQQFSSQIN